ncbi:hypothetical protein PM082_018223 [Marasmius tenuissimus]|nr:hypothetical protein PM082_018223 [Marasmius tenuissimus]
MPCANELKAIKLAPKTRPKSNKALINEFRALHQSFPPLPQPLPRLGNPKHPPFAEPVLRAMQGKRNVARFFLARVVSSVD